MKKVNKSGFTLIELLAVIVILGVILGISVPAVSTIISNSKKDAFVADAKEFVSAVNNLATISIFNYPADSESATIIALNNAEIKLDKGGMKSPFGNKYDKANSYVAIINISTLDDPTYQYFIALKDDKGMGLNLTFNDDITRKSIKGGMKFSPPTTTITIKDKIYTVK